MEITALNFFEFDIRVGTIVAVSNFEKARNPAYILEIDFGEIGVKKSSAQITHYYTKEQLIGQQVVAVVNLPIKQIANFFSEAFVLGVIETKSQVVLLQPAQKVENGLKIG